MFGSGLICITTFSQHVYQLRADSIQLKNNTANAEFILENSTKNVNGFLYNRSNGRTEFRRAMVKVNDSTYVFGSDTLRLNAFSNYVWNTTTQQPSTNFNIGGNGVVGGTFSVGGSTILAPYSGSYARVGIGTPSPAYTLDVNGWGRLSRGLYLDNVMDYDGLVITGNNYVPLITLKNVGGSNVSMLGWQGLTLRTNGAYAFQNSSGSVAYFNLVSYGAYLNVPVTITGSLTVSGNTTFSSGQVIKRSVLTSTTTLDDTAYYVAADASSAAFSINLRTAVGRAGRVFKFKKIDGSSNAVTISVSIVGQTIDGQSTYVLQNQWQVLTIVSNGSNWEIL